MDKQEPTDNSSLHFVNEDTYFGLEWVNQDGKLHKDVRPVCFKTGVGDWVVKCARVMQVDGGEKVVVPVCEAFKTLVKLMGVDGDKNAKYNTSEKEKRPGFICRDSHLAITFFMESQKWVDKFEEILKAHVLAALLTRDIWVGPNWSKSEFKYDEVVENKVRSKFGFISPMSKTKSETAKAEQEAEMMSPVIRMPRDGEHFGMMKMKCTGVTIPDKHGSPDDTDAEFKEGTIMSLNDFLNNKTVYLYRKDITRFSTGFIKFACLGVSPAGKGYNMWRIFSAILKPGEGIGKMTVESIKKDDRMAMLSAVASTSSVSTADYPDEPITYDEGEPVESVKRKREDGDDESEAKRAHAESDNLLNGVVLNFIRKNQEKFKDGVPLRTIASIANAPIEDVRAVTDKLLADMEIFCTVDMETFKTVA